MLNAIYIMYNSQKFSCEVNHVECSEWTKDLITRKSSCLNARGIPTAAYQVLPRWGTPPPGKSDGGGTRGGVPPQRWGTPLGYPPVRIPHQGTPHWGTPLVGIPPCQGTPIRVLPVGVPPPGSTGGYPCQGTPPLGYPPSGTPHQV